MAISFGLVIWTPACQIKNKGVFIMGLTMKQVAANRKFYAETGAKPYTRLNIWLCVWIPLICFTAVGGLLGNKNFNDIKLYIAPVVSWILNIVVIIARTASKGKTVKALIFNISCSILYFFGLILAPIFSLIMSLWGSGMSAAAGDYSAAAAQSGNSSGDGFFGSIKKHLVVYQMIHYEGVVPFNASAQNTQETQVNAGEDAATSGSDDQ